MHRFHATSADGDTAWPWQTVENKIWILVEELYGVRAAIVKQFNFKSPYQ